LLDLSESSNKNNLLETKYKIEKVIVIKISITDVVLFNLPKNEGSGVQDEEQKAASILSKQKAAFNKRTRK
jgi:hypothetical protein